MKEDQINRLRTKGFLYEKTATSRLAALATVRFRRNSFCIVRGDGIHEMDFHLANRVAIPLLRTHYHDDWILYDDTISGAVADGDHETDTTN